jgi:hypothetical protein
MFFAFVQQLGLIFVQALSAAVFLKWLFLGIVQDCSFRLMRLLREWFHGLV